jgi:hypothetical protein
MTEEAKLLAEHYQKTYELTFELSRERNRTFLLLLGLIGVAAILAFRISHTDALLIDIFAKWSGISDPMAITELKSTFSYALLQSILQVAVFYLMVNLYHRNDYVNRNYAYLALLEDDIRSLLGDQAGILSFTREGNFYWTTRPRLFGMVKWVYIVLLGGLLLAFTIGRVVDDCRTGSELLIVVDAVVGGVTILFFYGYASSSVVHDKRAHSTSKTPSERTD